MWEGLGGSAERGPEVLIMGVGNRLLRDDGVGSCFAEVLGSLVNHWWIRVVDGGLGGLNLLDYFEGVKLAYVVDAVEGERPGQVVLYKVNSEVSEEALRMVVEYGSHGISPDILLAAAASLGYLPEAYVVGISVKLIDLGEALSEEVILGSLKALKLIKGELARRGFNLEVDEEAFLNGMRGCGGV